MGMEPWDDDTLDSTGRLGVGLRGLYGRAEPGQGFDRVDSAVLGAARRRFAFRRRARAARVGVIGGAGAAAAGLVVAAVVWAPGSGVRMSQRVALGADVDGSGVVDIADALAIARAVERSSAPSGWDVDGDGAVTLADADAVAERAVSLDRFDLGGAGEKGVVR